MKFEILYGRTTDDLNKQVAERLADGWETKGEPVLNKVGIKWQEGELVRPSQLIVKED